MLTTVNEDSVGNLPKVLNDIILKAVCSRKTELLHNISILIYECLGWE